MNRIWLPLLLLPALLHAAEPRLAETRATYLLERGALTLGTADFNLTRAADDCYRYEYVARPQGIAKLFIGNIREVSDFCMVDGRIQSRRFSFSRADRAKDDYVLEFDLDKGEARTDRGQVQRFEGYALDRLVMQLAVQQWVLVRGGEPGPEEFSVTKVEDDRIKTYRFRIVARETLLLGGAEVPTVRVERTDDPKKSVRFWLDPARDYLAVRVEQTKGGDTQLRMVLQ
jgi:hypothetical protein